MNLSIALHDEPLPDDEQPAPEKRKQRWGGALAPKKHKSNDFAYIYQHERPFVPEWADKAPGSCPQLPTRPPGGKP